MRFPHACKTIGLELRNFKMGLFIVFAIIICMYFIFCSGGLVDYFKTMDEYNKEIYKNIKYGRINRDLFFEREYSKKDLRTIPRGICVFIFFNIAFNIMNFFAVFFVTLFLSFALPMEPYDYSFDINSLKDTTTIEGRIYGRRGYIEEDMSYFFLRDDSYGERMGHIPADKTYIQYNDKVSPHITVYKEKTCAPDWLQKILPVNVFSLENVVRYELVVPSGSVIEDTYEIDME